MCEHGSIFDELAEVIPNHKPEKTIRGALIDEGIITRKNGRIVNIKAGINLHLINVRYKVDEINLKSIGGYATFIVTLAMNEVYHLRKNQINYDTEERVTEEQENYICCHEKGHQELSGKIISEEGLTFEENFDSNIKTKQQIINWLKQVGLDWNRKFDEIYKRAEYLYHKKYGDKGSPWTFDINEELCNESGSSWQKDILGKLKEEYPYELSRLSVE
jgi:hypothetical protein